MRKPHGTLRYMVLLPAGGPAFVFDPFTDPDDFGNVIGSPLGVPPVPADLRIWPLGPQPIGAGDFGKVTIAPLSVTFDPVTGATLDVVLSVLNESAGPLLAFVIVEAPAVSALSL